MFESDFRERPSLVKGFISGAVAGVVASYAMNEFQSGMASLFDSESAKQAQPSSEPANVKAARKVSRTVLHHRLKPNEKQPAGEAMHYAMGIGSAMIYGAAAEYSELVRAAAGTVFGATVWVLADEVAVPMLGFSKPPDEYPVSVHAKALTAHLFYGVVTELTRRSVRAML